MDILELILLSIYDLDEQDYYLAPKSIQHRFYSRQTNNSNFYL